jgi:nitroimidazol reductase NimA-like FMN-containing flavoprotein (pyridoxamine 5'-phosphate oxidase superfamily)
MEHDLQAAARRTLDENRYMVLGTSEPDGSPRVSPVYFTDVAARTIYWVSSVAAHHSRNLDERPRVSIVVFDSARPPKETTAVYLSATAEQVPDGDLETACAEAFAAVGDGARAFTPDELRAPGVLRLYRATVHTHELHVRGSDPTHGTGVDTRLTVTMS